MTAGAMLLRELLMMLADRLLRYAEKRMEKRNRKSGADVRVK